MNDTVGMATRIRTLIVDDEAAARRSIWLLLQNDPEIQVVGQSASGADAIADIEQLAPDLVFLDVQMPGANGFEVLAQAQIARLPVIVFVTAYDEYAVRAFEIHAADYLLKPFSDARFAEAVQQAKRRVGNREVELLSRRLLQLLADRNTRATGAGTEADYVQEIVVRSEGRVTFLDAATIDWVEAQDDYLVLHAGSQRYTVRSTMKAMERRLNPRQFFRTHRSTIVNLRSIKELQQYFHGDLLVILRDGTQLKLSRRRRGKLAELLGQAI